MRVNGELGGASPADFLNPLAFGVDRPRFWLRKFWGLQRMVLGACWLCMNPEEQSRGGSWTPNIAAWRNDGAVCSLSQVLEEG